MSRVAINIVTYNSASTIDACLEAVFGQDYRDFLVTVIDNNSTDDTVDRVKAWQQRGVNLTINATNEYFSRAHNRAIRQTDSEFVVTLNPDVMIHSDYLSQVLHAFELSPGIGSVNGKLLLLEPGELRPEILQSPPRPDAVIDGAGLMMYESRRPYLRGNRKLSRRFCLRPQYIFGVDAACGAYRRTMLEDVTIDGECFDNDFVIYREDVDIAWRAKLFGWDSYYVPTAVGYHVRGFHLGRGRRAVRNELKRHSVRNGWLLLVKNDTMASVVRYAPFILPYQLKIAAGLLTIETSSLPAIPEVGRLLPRMLQKREQIQARRRRPEEEMRLWFE